MIHVDVTVEDTRIIAHEVKATGIGAAETTGAGNDGDNAGWMVDALFFDNISGKCWHKEMTFVQLSAVIALCFASDGETVEAVNYASIAVLFEGCPQECRPIP